MNLDNALAYDIETFPNCFTLAMEMIHSDFSGVWEISHFRDDRRELMQWFSYLAQNRIPMIGFNTIGFDYPVIHYIFNNPNCTVEQIYEKAMSIINSQNTNRFAHTIWPRDRFAPQIDLFKIHHFDNKAKSTSLKALQINMRAPSVVDMPIPLGTILTKEQIDHSLIPYNKHDVKETKRFAGYSKDAIGFRSSLLNQFDQEVMNWNDTKIGAQILEKRLGDELCYDFSSGKKVKRQTPRTRIALGEIIFPYVFFNNAEFNRVLDYLKQQVLTTDEIKTIGQDDTAARLKTKGVFNDLKAHVGGIDFCFGTGGIHGSVERQRIVATDDWHIIDIDVKALYPNIAIVNRLAPEHLGERFVEEYSNLPKEREKWQKEKGSKCTEANSMKLASNGTYGNTNNVYSIFYDPKVTMQITLNGQLMLCMLAERLVEVPTLKLIQINTDGMTYFIHKDHVHLAKQIEKEWQAATALVLEEARYTRMFIRDVNNYIAVGIDDKIKTKGAYWTPDPLDYHNSISQQQPPKWHADISNTVSTRAAVAAMIHNVPVETFVRLCTNPYDFMLRAKVGKSDQLMHGSQEIQKTSRYYVSNHGEPLVKISPPTGPLGMPKRANGVTEAEYLRVMEETGWQRDERVCTKDSFYEIRNTNFQAGYKTSLCNNVQDFDFSNINYQWYIAEAKKLIV